MSTITISKIFVDYGVTYHFYFLYSFLAFSNMLIMDMNYFHNYTNSLYFFKRQNNNVSLLRSFLKEIMGEEVL